MSTRFNQWWGGVPFITSGVVIICGLIYLVCLLFGYDSYHVCFLPSAVISRFEMYRIFTAVLFHGSILHLIFNMLALIPLGTELERIMGSVRLLYLIVLLSISNVVFHLSIASLTAYNPVMPYPHFMNECATGFYGILFSMIVIDTRLSGAQSRSVFGLFNVPAQWYAWILLIAFQLLASNVSLLGHLCGILSGFAYSYGFFNRLSPGSSFYTTIESTSMLVSFLKHPSTVHSPCIRRPGFILCTGGATYGNLPTHTNSSSPSSGFSSGSLWRNISTWMPQRETAEPAQDSRFPGRGRTLASTQIQSNSTSESDESLQARLLDDPSLQSTGPQISYIRHLAPSTGVAELISQNQGTDKFEEELKKLISMGFEKIQAEVVLTAADGDPNVAIEILMTQKN